MAKKVSKLKRKVNKPKVSKPKSAAKLLELPSSIAKCLEAVFKAHHIAMLYSDGKMLWLVLHHYKYIDYKKKAEKVPLLKTLLPAGYFYCYSLEHAKQQVYNKLNKW